MQGYFSTQFFLFDTGEYFICFAVYMEIFPGVFSGCMNNFHENISMAMDTNTATLGSQVQIPNRTKTICKVRRFHALYTYVPFKRLKLKPKSKKREKSPTGYGRLFFAQINLLLRLSVHKHSHNS